MKNFLKWLFHTHTYHQIDKMKYIAEARDGWFYAGAGGFLYYRCCGCGKYKAAGMNEVVFGCLIH